LYVNYNVLQTVIPSQLNLTKSKFEFLKTEYKCKEKDRNTNKNFGI